MFEILNEQTGKSVALRLVLGRDASELIREKCLETIAMLDEWKEVSYSTKSDEL